MGGRTKKPRRPVRLEPVETRIPKHGGGVLQSGNPGNGGRSAAVARAQSAESYRARIPAVEAMADGIPWSYELPPEVEGGQPRTIWVPITNQDRLRAHELLARYGLDTRTQGIDLGDVRDRLAKTLETIREMLPPEMAVALVERLRPIWKAA